ncbi:MAG TPA: hypothetical protein VFG68_19295 [Fimbriiglobus sp.]|nr:hypothetical protein [Fimbriiglobus sp.]
MTPDYSKHMNPETFNTDPVYIFDLEFVPCPPGTPAAPRPPDRPRVAPDPDEPLPEPILYIFEDRPQPPPSE